MMNLLNALTWQNAAVMIVGLIFVVSGINSFSEYFRRSKPNNIFEGIVQNSVHKELRDDKNNLIQYYWDLSIRYKKGNRIIPVEIKSTTQYEKDEKLKITEQNGRPVIVEDTYSNIWTGILLAAAGVLVILAPIIMEAVSVKAASYIISIVLVLIAGALFTSYQKESTSGMQEIKGTISDLVLFQTDKEKRYLVSPKHWYPLISYELNGSTRQFLSKINSEYQSSFKVGSEVTLYKNPEDGSVVERKPSKLMLAAAIALLALAIVGLISTVIGM